MADTINIEQPFREVFAALDLKDQRKALRGAMRLEANRLKKSATANLRSSGLGQGTRQRLDKGFIVRVFPARLGAGFLVKVKPYRKKGYHLNRQGKEKPVLMWAEEGTKQRKTRTRSKFFIRQRRGHVTGRMRAYRFLTHAEAGATNVEANLFNNFQDNLDKALRKQKLI